MGSGLLGTNIGNGFFGFDPTPHFSATNVVKTQAKNNAYLTAGEQPGHVNIPGATKVAAPANTGTGSGPVAATFSNGPASSGSSYSGGGYVGGGAAAAPAIDSAAIAQYQDQINSLNQLLGSADITRNNGVNAINTSFNNNNARLNQQQSSTLSRYDTQKQDTTGDYGKTVNKINTNARNGFNSLQMLLGGTGSAGEILAPYAVSTQANSQRGESSDAFARNLRDIDTAVTDAKTKYKNAQDDLLGQKNGKLQALLSSIDAQKMNYQQQIAAAKNQINVAKGGKYVTPVAQNNAISALLADQQNLGRQYADPQYQVQDVQTMTPDMAAYQAQAAQLAGGNNAPDGGVDDTTAALQALLKKPDQNTSTYSY